LIVGVVLVGWGMAADGKGRFALVDVGLGMISALRRNAGTV